ncbi:MAG: hypothetical protein ACLQM6_12700 [Acidobacteriaceae bacterium]
MLYGHRHFFLLPLAALLACGSTPSKTAPLNLSGNWEADSTQFIAYSGAPTLIHFAGPLQFSNGSVTGTMSATILGGVYTNGSSAPGCAPSAPPTTVTGTLDANNNFTLSVPIAGGTATLTAILSTTPNASVGGSFQIVGGSCAAGASTMSIAQYTPVIGTYAGSLLVTNDPVITIHLTAVLNQSTTPVNGQYPLSGTVTVTGVCNVTFNLNADDSFVAGNSMSASTSPLPVTLGPILTGTTDPTADRISFALFVDVTQPLSPCVGPYSGALTLQ